MSEEPTFSLNRLADLAGVSHALMRRRLVAAGGKPGKDGRWPVRTVLKCLLADPSDYRTERTKLVIAQREKVERENLEAEGRLVDKDEVYRQFEPMFVAIRQSIIASHLSEIEQRDLVRELQNHINPKHEPELATASA